MKKFTVVANITAKSECVEQVKTELLNLIETSRKEEGCISYDLHQDNENSAHFMFYENWESRELWQRHTENSHILEYKKRIDGALESVTISEMSYIDK